ncbi:MAG: NAD(P)/FAD-dependent oxidoreductase [Acidisphaera sp.]|nr:NAD(P)/FAD-dependent oxidoreductase [Acidisphaera sp.]
MADTDLPELERQVARDLRRLGLPAANWPATVAGPDGLPMADVAVVGAGMCGVAAAAALTFRGVRNIVLLDRSEPGREGPWLDTARMEMLRSPKQLPGIPLGLPSLTFRAWYEARHGEGGWRALYKISNADWAAYVSWVRRVLDLPLQSQTGLRRLLPGDGHLGLVLEGAEERIRYARRVVLATGRGGAGGNHVPDFVSPDLFPDRAAHTGDPIDFSGLAGRTVAVLGAGPSAWDAAATALEAGAARVDMYARRPALPQINKGRGSANPGFFEGYPALDAADKWALMVYLHDLQAPPPHESVHRALRHPGFAIHLGTPVREARRADAGVALVVGPDHRPASADFLVVGTGFRIDLAHAPELAEMLPQIATWGDRYEPPPALRRASLARYPWLGDGFELIEREPGACPSLGRVHLFNHAATASLGAIASDIPGVDGGAARLATHIVRHFFREDFAHVRAALEAFAEPELETTPFYVPEVFRE